MKYPSQLDFPNSPFAKAARQPLMLGFMPPLKGNAMQPHLRHDFAHTLAMVQLAERVGFDMAMSSAQWAPIPEWENGYSLDAFVTPMAMLGATSRIILISTLHLLYGSQHPLHIAKYAATMDHISQGRWGLNVITGYANGEFNMFGHERPEHDLRFEHASEFVDAMHEMWAANEPGYTRKSVYRDWGISNAWVSPKPLHGRPIMVSAGGSPAAIDFFANHSDAIFTATPSQVTVDDNLRVLPGFTERIKANHPKGKVWISPCIVADPTMEQALARIERNTQFIKAPPAPTPMVSNHHYSDSLSWEHKKGARPPGTPDPKGISGTCEMYGPPELIAEQLIALHATGLDGVLIRFLDLERDLEHFGEHVMPLLVKAGIRLNTTSEENK